MLHARRIGRPGWSDRQIRDSGGAGGLAVTLAREGRPGCGAPAGIACAAIRSPARPGSSSSSWRSPAIGSVSPVPDARPLPHRVRLGVWRIRTPKVARGLLIAAPGAAAVCMVCRGRARAAIVADDVMVPCGADDEAGYDPEVITACPDCDDGHRQLPCQQFKSGPVAAWDRDAEWVPGRGRDHPPAAGNRPGSP